MILLLLIFLSDSVKVDTTKIKADTLMLGRIFTEQRMQKARIDTKLDSILVELKKKATLEKVKAKVKK